MELSAFLEEELFTIIPVAPQQQLVCADPLPCCPPFPNVAVASPHPCKLSCCEAMRLMQPTWQHWQASSR